MIRAIVQVSFDGSYGRALQPNGPRFMAYGGMFGSEDAWKALGPIWHEALQLRGIEAFRTSELRGTDGFDGLRAQLATAAHDVGLRAVGIAADVALLSTGAEASRER